MNISFDKIYVISYVRNVQKQQKIKEYLNNIWNIDFEFIYGFDANELINIFNLNNIHFIYDNNNELSYNIGHISCAVAHYTAIQHAYVNKYNSCLIIEDDTLFTDDLNYIEYCFNNMPDDADGCRFALTWRNMNNIDNYNSFWIIDECYCGAQCYSINNREKMLHYINNMHIKFREADDNSLLEGKKIYQLKTLIGKDPASYLQIK